MRPARAMPPPGGRRVLRDGLRDLRERSLALLRSRAGPLGVLAVPMAGLGALLALEALPGAVAPTGTPAVLGALLGVGAALGGLLVGRGLVAPDFRSGTALLWLQRPGSGVRFYAGRLTDALLVGAFLVLGLALGLALLLAPGDPAAAAALLGRIPAALLLVVLQTLLVFGLSGAGASMDGLAAVVYLVGGMTLAGVAAVRPELVGPLGTGAAAVTFPADAFLAVSDAWARGSPRAPTPHLVHLALYGLGWTIVGLLGTALQARSPVRPARTR